jgi:hypothetical protein
MSLLKLSTMLLHVVCYVGTTALHMCVYILCYCVHRCIYSTLGVCTCQDVCTRYLL